MFFSDIYQADSPVIFPPFPHPTRFGVQSVSYRTAPLRFKPTLPHSALWRFSLSSDSNWYFGFACGCLLSLPTGGVGGSLRRQRREQRLVPTWLIPVRTAVSSNSSRWFQFVVIPTLAKPVVGLLSDTAPDKQQALLRGLGRPHEVPPSNFMFSSLCSPRPIWRAGAEWRLAVATSIMCPCALTSLFNDLKIEPVIHRIDSIIASVILFMPQDSNVTCFHLRTLWVYFSPNWHEGYMKSWCSLKLILITGNGWACKA